MNHPRAEAWAAARRGEPTARQAEVLAYVKGYMRATGMPPTIREIGLAMGIASPNGVRVHLDALARKGLMHRIGPDDRRQYLSRCYVPVVPDGACPCCGRPTAGEDGR